MTQQATLIVHAPNIHTGGGLHVLNALLRVAASRIRYLASDARASDTVRAPAGAARVLVEPTLGARLLAEWQLRKVATVWDTVLCFHSLPPLFPVAGRVVVFVHSRLLVTQGALSFYSRRVRLRIRLERLWLMLFSHRVARYVVQTQSMAVALREIIGAKPEIVISPCVPEECVAVPSSVDATKLYDFVYVASGEAHKNHASLLEAWVLLAKEGIYPSLAITVDSAQHTELVRSIDQLTVRHSLHCVNLGVLSAGNVAALYQSSKALIYPSWTESFGLPLLEAAAHGLPIVASELDFVRDVVVPAESFDPHSALSIARAVRRFLRCAETPAVTVNATQFLDAIF